MSTAWDDDDDGDSDDLPATHLDDEAYEGFLEREFGRDGRPRAGPRVAFAVLLLVVLVLAVAMVVLR